MQFSEKLKLPMCERERDQETAEELKVSACLKRHSNARLNKLFTGPSTKLLQKKKKKSYFYIVRF